MEHGVPAALREALSRRLALAGSFNLRDTGGYPTREGRRTRWGALLRSEHIPEVPEANRQALLEYGVRTVIDLRTAGEIARFPDRLAGAPEINYRHLPLLDEKTMRALAPLNSHMEQYPFMLEQSREQVKAIVEGVRDAPEGGVLVHCAVGKDRTGLVVALLLGAAGVEQQVIVEDYALSAEHLASYFAQARQRAIAGGYNMARFEWEIQAKPETMQYTLERLEQEHGGVAGYLKSAGVEEGTLTSIRERLTEQGGGE